MPNVPAGNVGFITEMDIRRVLRDFPEANNLLDDYEFDYEEIRQAMTLTVDEWNDMAPVVFNYTIDNFPYRSILLKGTVAWLLTIGANSGIRNGLDYQAGGATIKDNDPSDYQRAAAALAQEVKQLMRMKKNEENYAQCWGTC